ncbi:protein LURP-one-related 15 [Tanacetum coccineum]|uniref:Protein LURP-one-related 15 n=1 Tax=Tanacetum coccineum TaxID=301880 RepID=A0ABQ4WQV4_9ASTR
MAAQTSYTSAQMSNSDTIVSPQFLAPYPVDLTITRKEMTFSLGNFSVTDANGNVVFKVKPTKFSVRDRHSLLDAADNPILSFQKMMHKKYNVHTVQIDTFDVIVNPNVNYAFIVTLIVILCEINEEKDAAL